MVRRYSEEEAEDNKSLYWEEACVYECPECGFTFSATHTMDDEEGGYTCPSCAEEELEKEIEKWKELFFLLKKDHELDENWRTEEWIIKAKELGVEF